MLETSCRICGNAHANREHFPREMMFGYREVFRYIECGRCGCLQIAEIPPDMSRYYPDGYYSYGPVSVTPRVGLRSLLSGYRNEYAFLKTRRIIGRALNWLAPVNHRDVADVAAKISFSELRRHGITFDSPILDVGCGSGGLLAQLACLGFRQLLGVDPYIASDLDLGGLRVLRRSLDEIEGQFDIIMFHHSFEHMADPLHILSAVAERLTSNGICIVRIPVAASEAWRRYGVNWVQLDAPRHFYLHTLTSIGLLADKAGLHIYSVVWDSTAFQFWGSEQYLRDIPLHDDQSFSRNRAVVSESRLAQWECEAERLNAQGRGDQAALYLRRREVCSRGELGRNW